jgi:hypothetical protein
MGRIITGEEEVRALLVEHGPDMPENSAFLSRLVGGGAKEVAAADIFWNTGQVPDLTSLPPVTKVYVNCDGEAPGVAAVDNIPRGRWSSGRRHMTVRCQQPQALRWMLSLLPHGEPCDIETSQQELLPEIEKLARVRGAQERLYYTVDRESLRPANHAAVIWLGKGSEAAVRRFSDRESGDGGLARFYHALQVAGFPFKTAAVLDANRIVSFCCVGMKTERVWSVKWICSMAGQRQRGHGKQVLSAATSKVLEMGKLPVYSLRESNLASRRLCESVGYRLVSVTTTLLVSV